MPVTIGGSGPITGVTSINTTVTDTELGYLDGVTSAIQSQIDGKATYTNWTGFTPTFSGTGWAVGNGTFTNVRYAQIGKVVIYKGYFTFGSTTTAGAGGLSMSLPVTAANIDGWVGNAVYTDSGVNEYLGNVVLGGTTTLAFRECTVSGSKVVVPGGITTTAPFTWGTNDYIRWTMTYEAA